MFQCSERIVINNPEMVFEGIIKFENELTIEAANLLEEFPQFPDKDDYKNFGEELTQEYFKRIKPDERTSRVIEKFLDVYINSENPRMLVDSSHDLLHVLSVAYNFETIIGDANLDENSEKFKDGLTKEELKELGRSCGIMHDISKGISPGIEKNHGLKSANYFSEFAQSLGYSSGEIEKMKKAISSHEMLTSTSKFRPTTILDYNLIASDKIDAIGKTNVYRWKKLMDEHGWDWDYIVEYLRSKIPPIKTFFHVRLPQLLPYVEEIAKETETGLERASFYLEPRYAILYYLLL
jgi:HD superfamily phosphodiesterase